MGKTFIKMKIILYPISISGAKGDATILRPSVPALLDKIYKGINSKINASGPFMAQFVDFCVRYIY